MPLGAIRRSSYGDIPRLPTGLRLNRPAAVDDEGLSGHEGRFIAGEIDDECGDLLGIRHSPHRRPRDERGAGLFVVALRLHALDEGGRLDAAVADGIDADALAGEVGGERLGHADDGGLGGAIEETGDRALDTRGDRGHLNAGAY